jgi:hypothetical protein
MALPKTAELLNTCNREGLDDLGMLAGRIVRMT